MAGNAELHRLFFLLLLFLFLHLLFCSPVLIHKGLFLAAASGMIFDPPFFSFFFLFPLIFFYILFLGHRIFTPRSDHLIMIEVNVFLCVLSRY